MNRLNVCRLMTILAAVMALTVIQPTKSAAENLELQLRGKILGEGCRGVAVYIETDTHRQFFATVKNATPGAVLGVAVRSKTNHQKLGTMRVNKLGEAYLHVDSRFHKLPPCQSGDQVEIWQVGEMVASGLLSK